MLQSAEMREAHYEKEIQRMRREYEFRMVEEEEEDGRSRGGGRRVG